jgi:hypothetical protein
VPALEAVIGVGERAALEVGRTLGPVLAILAHLEATKPPNWPSTLAFPRLHELVDDGWPVMWVPREDVLTELMYATTEPERRRVVVDHGDALIGHAASVLQEAVHPDLAFEVECMGQVLASLKSAPYPAQLMSLQVATIVAQKEAGFSSLSGLRRHLETLTSRGLFLPPGGGRAAMTLVAVLPLLSQFDRNKGQSIPRWPNRHAVSHTISSDQYSESDAIWSVLVAVSVLRQAHKNRCPTRVSSKSVHEGRDHRAKRRYGAPRGQTETEAREAPAHALAVGDPHRTRADTTPRRMVRLYVP